MQDGVGLLNCCSGMAARALLACVLLASASACQKEGVPSHPPGDGATGPAIGPSKTDGAAPLSDTMAVVEAAAPDSGGPALDMAAESAAPTDVDRADAPTDASGDWPSAPDALPPPADVVAKDVLATIDLGSLGVDAGPDTGPGIDARVPDAAPAVPCQTVDDCGPEETCRARACQSGLCLYLPISQGIACGTGLQCDGNGRCLGCAVAADCPGTDGECQSRTCVQGVCGLVIAKPGTRLAYQTPGDCHADVCSAAGVPAKLVDDTDLPVDNLACTRDVCTAGVPSHPLVTAGTACGSNGLCDGKGACTGCVVASDCPGQDGDCQTRTCNGGVCGFDVANAGKVLTTQAAGDCRKLVCDGFGGLTSVVDNADQPADDGNPCTDDSCANGAPVHPPKTARTTCSAGGGSLCDGLGACVACLQASDCGAATACRSFACASNQCETTLVTAGTKVANPVAGDCHSDQCDGKGALLANAVDDTDVPADDGNPCTDDNCKNGAPQHPARPTGSVCSQGGVACDDTMTCTNPPAVVATSPADGATVTVGVAVSVTFSGAMNPATLVGQASAGPCTGSVQVSLDDFTTCVALTGPQLATGDTGATFAATPGLLSGRVYKVRVTTAAQGATGLSLATPFTTAVGFQTRSPDSCTGSVVIAQIYGGGGSSAADTPYQNDYVQLHNRGGATADLTGYSLQYAAATGDTWTSVALTGTMAPGAFFLVQLGTAGPQGQPLPTPDFTGSTISLSATAGKIALVHSSAAMPRATCPSSDAVDFVGYGAANCSRSSNTGANPAPALTYLGALWRAGNGCTDTNLNSSDFQVAAPAPAGKSSPAATCACPPTILNESSHAFEADLCNVQPSLTLTGAVGVSTAPVLGQIYEAGVTEAAGAAPAIRAQLGMGPASRNPEYESGWTWTEASYDSQVGQSDQYAATFTPTSAGTYRFAYRVSLDGGLSWTYCDGAQGDGGAGAGTGLTFDLENLGTITVSP
jgi:hypothetical protein